MKQTHKITAALATGLFSLASFAGPVSANHFDNSWSGLDSDNNISVRYERDVDVDQRNTADFDNDVNVRLSTGGNKIDDNTDGDASIRTGDAEASVGIYNHANTNVANVGGHDGDHGWKFNISDNNGDWKGDHGKNNHDDHDSDKNDDYDYDLFDSDKDDHDYDKSHHKYDKDREDHDSEYSHDDRHHSDDSDHAHDFHASMNGHQEVPGPGDSDGYGHVKAEANHEENKLCVSMHVANIDPATAAHIHHGAKGVAGPVVVTLPTPNAEGYADGCINVDDVTLWGITESPWDYYVNVHNNPYPDGAVRGQLHY